MPPGRLVLLKGEDGGFNGFGEGYAPIGLARRWLPSA